MQADLFGVATLPDLADELIEKIPAAAMGRDNFLPVLPYLFDVVAAMKAPSITLFYISSLLTAITFLTIGFIKGKVGKQSSFVALSDRVS